MKKILSSIGISLLVGCGNIDTPIQGPVDEPFVEIPMNAESKSDEPPLENPTTFCKRNAQGEFDTTLKIEGGGTSKTFWWAQGGACVLKPLTDAWKLFQDQEKMAWDGTSNNEYLEHNVGKDGSHYFLNRYSATEFIFTVSWDMEWFHSIHGGDLDNPTSVLINYKKTAGTSHIGYWEGSIVLERVTDSITSFTMKNQIHADRTGLKETKETVRDLLTRVLR